MGITRPGTRSSPLEQGGSLFVAFFLPLLFGLVSVFLPAWFVVSVLVVPAVLMMALVRPEYALLALVALACDLVHPALVPRVPFLGGSLAAGDATLVMLTVGSVWMFAAQKGKADSGGLVGLPSPGLFGLCFLVAMPMSLWYRKLDTTLVLGEAPDFIYSIHEYGR